MDVQASISRRLARRESQLDVLGIGECSLDDVWLVRTTLPWGGKARAHARVALGGGQIATAMVACQRLGLRAGFAGAIGNDAAGAAVRSGLALEGVAVALTVVPGAATRSAVVIVDGQGERTIVEHRDALAAPPLDEARIAQARALHVDATDLDASLAAARLAREHGRLVSLDLDWAPASDDPRAAQLDELLALTDVCVAAAGVPEELAYERELERALPALALRLGGGDGGLAACTLGSDGAAAWTGERLVHAPAFPVHVVDTTACGDTFRAGLLCALLDDRPLAHALRFANAAAALKCRDLGRRGCPTRAEVERLLRRG
jgi:sugar/nucleoside kinase (ribokinase family)